MTILWNEVTILWNEVTIWWNEVTKGWNEVAWNEVVMERSDRIPQNYFSNAFFPAESYQKRFVLN